MQCGERKKREREEERGKGEERIEVELLQYVHQTTHYGPYLIALATYLSDGDIRVHQCSKSHQRSPMLDHLHQKLVLVA